jgi:hypothetical protein
LVVLTKRPPGRYRRCAGKKREPVAGSQIHRALPDPWRWSPRAFEARLRDFPRIA